MNIQGQRFSLFCISLLITSLFTTVCVAEIVTPYTPANQLDVEVSVSVTQNPTTQAYKYSYSLKNQPESKQSAWMFDINFGNNSQIFNISSPYGWRGGLHYDTSRVGWVAYKIDSQPEGYIRDGNLFPSTYNVKPGETLTGFSFESLASPAEFDYTILGFVKIPAVTSNTDAFHDAGIIIPDAGTEGINGIVSAPKASSYNYGGRRPAVDGFLAFLNLESNSIFKGKAIVVIAFAAAGETVYPDTFVASLNREDITHLFKPDDKFGGDMYAELNLDTSPLIEGKNVLITKVEGLVPGSSRRADDVDRVRFTFVP